MYKSNLASKELKNLSVYQVGWQSCSISTSGGAATLRRTMEMDELQSNHTSHRLQEPAGQPAKPTRFIKLGRILQEKTIFKIAFKDSLGLKVLDSFPPHHAEKSLFLKHNLHPMNKERENIFLIGLMHVSCHFHLKQFILFISFAHLILE